MSEKLGFLKTRRFIVGGSVTQDRYVQGSTVIDTLPWPLIDSFLPTMSGKIYVTCTLH